MFYGFFIIRFIDSPSSPVVLPKKLFEKKFSNVEVKSILRRAWLRVEGGEGWLANNKTKQPTTGSSNLVMVSIQLRRTFNCVLAPSSQKPPKVTELL